MEKDKVNNTLKLFIDDFLSSYNFDSNTKDVRDELKKGLDKICEFFLKGELIFYYKNVCDESINIQYVIDLKMLVSDTYIKFEENDDTIVIQSTILKKNFVNLAEIKK